MRRRAVRDRKKKRSKRNSEKERRSEGVKIEIERGR